MLKFTTKIIIPIILVGIFAIVIFISIGSERLGMSFYIVTFLFAVYVFFFGLAVGQNIGSPLKKLLDKAVELSKGDLSSRVYLETKDEFSELANIFNKIAEELEARRYQEANAEKSVGIKVKARTQELEETINALEQKVKNRTVELERLMEESRQLREEVSGLRQKVAKK